MYKENRSVPDESQMTYILRHWDDIHGKVEELKERHAKLEKQYSCAQLAIKRLRKQNSELNEEVKNLTRQNKQHSNTIKQLKDNAKMAKRKKPSLIESVKQWLGKLF